MFTFPFSSTFGSVPMVLPISVMVPCVTTCDMLLPIVFTNEKIHPHAQPTRRQPPRKMMLCMINIFPPFVAFCLSPIAGLLFVYTSFLFLIMSNSNSRLKSMALFYKRIAIKGYILISTYACRIRWNSCDKSKPFENL